VVDAALGDVGLFAVKGFTGQKPNGLIGKPLNFLSLTKVSSCVKNASDEEVGRCFRRCIEFHPSVFKRCSVAESAYWDRSPSSGSI